MSHNDNDATRSARKHRPALIAIAVAVLAALLLYVVFPAGVDEQNEGIATTPPPEDTPITDAEGAGDAAAPTISPDAAAPVGEDGETAPAN